ncbi:hypothetical protein BJ875DRAFT_501659 [Amylocarpus encephaloides]|uniref:Aminoglycoside phosphotransferase domain-containing protein n=1 Tax=Amylocarpus encephaloides TaxID=45428 RepID=A0A9P7YSC4_9HELO|nr:hypothetical protein BJ875DRAFT_501659 [Amylocarpus encephaloides]
MDSKILQGAGARRVGKIRKDSRELPNSNCKRLRKFCSASPPALAHKIYGDLVPSIMSFDSYALPVYVCPVIPGQVHMLQKFPKGAFPLQRQLTTVTELAQFVAKSAFWPQPNDSLRKIEPRFVNKASSLLEKVSLLDKLPPVLTHHDFAEVNIMVDLQGHVTGVIDFDDAQTEAFVPPEMRRPEFEEAVMVAVDIGIVNRYFVRGLIENVNLESEDHRSSLGFARGIFLAR